MYDKKVLVSILKGVRIMVLQNFVLENRYYDSVVLMSAASHIKKVLGVHQVSLMMGTDANKDVLRASKLLSKEGEKAGGGDLIVAVLSEGGVNFQEIEVLLKEVLAPKVSRDDEEYFPHSLDGALEIMPDANICVISIPGEYVEWEGKKLLDKGINMMIFSDNVPLDVEIYLKNEGKKRGILVMGPDCGTAIISGAALGFANNVRRGNIGIVAAAGTGIQEVSTIISKGGGGISHAIGTGGRDLSKEVGGITMQMGIEALEKDSATDIIVLISKPPHPSTEEKIFALLETVKKPVVVNFLGGSMSRKIEGVHFARTLEEASFKALELAGISYDSIKYSYDMDLVKKAVSGLSSSQRYMRGLYSGGTLTSEALLILKDAGVSVWSNVSKDPSLKLDNPFKSQEHTIVDMGEDVFTKGTPHPMIDSTKRIERILQEAEDPEVAVILMDLVLGYGANPNPAPEIAQAIKEAQSIANKDGRKIIFVFSICGVKDDPQDAKKQEEVLKEAGAFVFPTNASATRFVRDVLKQIEKA